jgi:hypothetical protein
MDGALRRIGSDRDHRLWPGKGARQAAERPALLAMRGGTARDNSDSALQLVWTKFYFQSGLLCEWPNSASRACAWRVNGKRIVARERWLTTTRRFTPTALFLTSFF